MNNDIRHSGIIENISDNRVKVRILQTSACAGCKVAGNCHAAEAKEKIVEVDTNGTEQPFKTGDQVTVLAGRDVVTYALRIAVIIPLLLLILTLVVVLQLTGNEALSGLVSIAVLILYYIYVWLMRRRIKQKVTFRLAEAEE